MWFASSESMPIAKPSLIKMPFTVTSEKALFTIQLKVMAASIDPTKARHVRLSDHDEHTSSNEYRMPPNGALNAAATPAAHPIPTHSRWLLGSRSSRSPRVHGTMTRERPEATMAPVCTIGPSFPNGKPVDTISVIPTTLATSVDSLRFSRTPVPLRYAFT